MGRAICVSREYQCWTKSVDTFDKWVYVVQWALGTWPWGQLSNIMSQLSPKGHPRARRGPSIQVSNQFKDTWVTRCGVRPLPVSPAYVTWSRPLCVSSHLCPVAACWRWSISPGSTSSELSLRTVAFATSQNPSLCLVQARRHWHLPAGCHRPPCHPPGVKREFKSLRTQAEIFKWSRKLNVCLENTTQLLMWKWGWKRVQSKKCCFNPSYLSA